MFNNIKMTQGPKSGNNPRRNTAIMKVGVTKAKRMNPVATPASKGRINQMPSKMGQPNMAVPKTSKPYVARSGGVRGAMANAMGKIGRASKAAMKNIPIKALKAGRGRRSV